MNEFHHHETVMKYLQYDANTCCLISLASAMFFSREYVAEKAIASLII